MPNKYVNKVVIGKETKLDLTADTITPDKLAKGITAHDKSGDFVWRYLGKNF